MFSRTVHLYNFFVQPLFQGVGENELVAECSDNACNQRSNDVNLKMEARDIPNDDGLSFINEKFNEQILKVNFNIYRSLKLK